MGDLTDLPRERSRNATKLKLKGHSCVPVKSGVFRKRRAFLGFVAKKMGESSVGIHGSCWFRMVFFTETGYLDEDKLLILSLGWEVMADHHSTGGTSEKQHASNCHSEPSSLNKIITIHTPEKIILNIQLSGWIHQLKKILGDDSPHWPSFRWRRSDVIRIYPIQIHPVLSRESALHYNTWNLDDQYE